MKSCPSISINIYSDIEYIVDPPVVHRVTNMGNPPPCIELWSERKKKENVVYGACKSYSIEINVSLNGNH